MDEPHRPAWLIGALGTVASIRRADNQGRMDRAYGFHPRAWRDMRPFRPGLVQRMKTGFAEDGIENGSDAFASTTERLQTALEDAGVIFTNADEEGPGVRLEANRAGQ